MKSRWQTATWYNTMRKDKCYDCWIVRLNLGKTLGIKLLSSFSGRQKLCVMHCPYFGKDLFACVRVVISKPEFKEDASRSASHPGASYNDKKTLYTSSFIDDKMTKCIMTYNEMNKNNDNRFWGLGYLDTSTKSEQNSRDLSNKALMNHPVSLIHVFSYAVERLRRSDYSMLK